MTRYGFEIKVDGSWVAANPRGGPPPYSFDQVASGRTMARVRYPALWRSAMAGGDPGLRVVARTSDGQITELELKEEEWHG